MLRVVIPIVLLVVVKTTICYHLWIDSPIFNLLYLFIQHQVSMNYLCGTVFVDIIFFVHQKWLTAHEA